MPRNLGRRVSRAWGAAAVLAAALVGGGAAAGHAAASPAPSEAKQIDLSAASLADLHAQGNPALSAAVSRVLAESEDAQPLFQGFQSG